jgi:hypothetical protein
MIILNSISLQVNHGLNLNFTIETSYFTDLLSSIDILQIIYDQPNEEDQEINKIVMWWLNEFSLHIERFYQTTL